MSGISQSGSAPTVRSRVAVRRSCAPIWFACDAADTPCCCWPIAPRAGTMAARRAACSAPRAAQSCVMITGSGLRTEHAIAPLDHIQVDLEYPPLAHDGFRALRVTTASCALRHHARSPEKNRFFASCCVMVEPPQRFPLRADFSRKPSGCHPSRSRGAPQTWHLRRPPPRASGGRKCAGRAPFAGATALRCLAQDFQACRMNAVVAVYGWPSTRHGQNQNCTAASAISSAAGCASSSAW